MEVSTQGGGWSYYYLFQPLVNEGIVGDPLWCSVKDGDSRGPDGLRTHKVRTKKSLQELGHSKVVIRITLEITATIGLNQRQRTLGS